MSKGLIGTQGPDGSFTIRVLAGDTSGASKIDLLASRPSTSSASSEICLGSLVI